MCWLSILFRWWVMGLLFWGMVECYDPCMMCQQLIGDLLNNNMILLPFAIDPHGRLGPVFNNFLYQSSTPIDLKFQRHLPNAQTMAYRAVHEPSPIGILHTADNNWKHNKTRPFFGHSHTSPTPSIYTIQHLGSGITKGFATLIRNGTKISTPQSATHYSPTHTQTQDLNSVAL